MINQKKIAVKYVEQHPKDSADRTKARKKVRGIFLISQQTLNEWESDLEKSLPEGEVTLDLLKHAGGFYKMTRGEIKKKPLTLKDTSGNDYEIKDPQKLRNHIMQYHANGQSIYEENGHSFYVDDKFRDLIFNYEKTENETLEITDDFGEFFVVKDAREFRKHIFLEHSTGTSIHEEEGHYFTVDDDFRKLILMKHE